ncbi:GNAT family N-acetyltransferase [Cellulosimicrobium protaetiae]|uniref:GNAT family N-acetyltransferase n=1 Tax=Cellulosimicrobium protaetiae TaxID=2587808 RepID=A0A6M5UE97_9MICO|nr:GNAT family N-acetyltransferase [Cellulosimicrobium protaetiae]QJW35982.1 GNAT family N-acetyltransferase [Cellulosimicrobium protaetiae]
MHARTLLLSDVTAEDEARWRGLAARAVEPNPFLDPAFLLTAARWFPATAGIRLVVVEDVDRMLALLPLSVEPRFQGLPLPYATTAGPFLSRRAPLCAPLVDDGSPVDALTALLRYLSERGTGLPGLVELTLLPGTGALHGAILEAARETRTPLLERYRFERASMRPVPEGSSWRDGLSTSRRKKLGRLARNVERELGAPLVAEDRGPDPRALEEFLDLEAAGWKGTTERGGALRVTPNGVEWFTEVADGFRERGLLRIFTLSVGEETLFMSVSLVCGRGVFALMDTYDERFARLSPGVVGRAAEVDHFLADPAGVDVFDQCMHPKHVESSALYPQRRAFVGLLLAPRGVVNRTLVRALPRAAAVRTTLRERLGRRSPGLEAA